MTILLMACFANLCKASGTGPHALSDPGPAELKRQKSLHSTAVPLIKCAECRVQFSKLQVFCTCKYSLITAIKEDCGRLADGECYVVLIRVWMHFNTSRMLTSSKHNGLLGPDKLYPDADFAKLIITCSNNVCATEEWEDETEWEKQWQRKLWRWDGKTEAWWSRMQSQWKTDVLFLNHAVLGSS